MRVFLVAGAVWFAYAVSSFAQPVTPPQPPIPLAPPANVIGPQNSGAKLIYVPANPDVPHGVRYRRHYARSAGGNIYSWQGTPSMLNHFEMPWYWNPPCERIDYSPYRYSLRHPKIYSPIYQGGESPPTPHLYPNSWYSSYGYYPAVKPTATGLYYPATIYYHQPPTQHYRSSLNDYYYHDGCWGSHHKRSCCGG